MVPGAPLSYKKSSETDVEYKGHIEDTTLLVNLLPAEYLDIYVRDATSPVMIYEENGFADLTGIFETNGGAICFIRQSNKEKTAKPTVCPKRIVRTHSV